MKLLLIVYSGTSPNRISSLLEEHRVDGWTELDRVHGAGRTGRREGSRAWPGDSALFFTTVDDERVADLSAALMRHQDELPPGERLHVAVMPVEQFF